MGWGEGAVPTVSQGGFTDCHLSLLADPERFSPKTH